MNSRVDDIRRFYDLLAELEERIGGKRVLSNCKGSMGWPTRGVYFFFELGEVRSDTGPGPRVVRIGTHGLRSGGRASLWGRLSQHKGVTSSGGGNRHGSIFRKLMGAALIERDKLTGIEAWNTKLGRKGRSHSIDARSTTLREAERRIERAVSEYIRAMPFIWVAIDDLAGAESDRGLIERNSIGLLSNFAHETIDLPSIDWLGRLSDRDRVRRSDLWNWHHVNDGYDSVMFQVLRKHVARSSLLRGAEK